MIFGDPYRFAIWVELIPEWSQTHKNGFFYFFVNGSMYPDDIRTSTLSVDFNDVIDERNALISLPYDDCFFKASANEAFQTIFKLAYPEPSQDDEYPEQVFDYFASPTIINDSGAHFFAIANEDSVRIIGGKISNLVDADDHRVWEDIRDPKIEDVVIHKNELNEILNGLRGYITSIL